MEDAADRIVPDLETRVEEAVRVFRENHRHPANLALHAVGYWFAARGSWRVLRGSPVSGLMDVAAAAGLLILGHRLEGNEPFTAIRTFTQQREPGAWTQVASGSAP